MRFTVLTLFPRFFDSPLREGLLGKALEEGKTAVEIADLRAFGLGKHRQVDDHPFGGGAGMVLRPEVGVAALRRYKQPGSHAIHLTPAGAPLDQSRVVGLVGWPHLILLCGRYEGIDERIVELEIDECLSLGDYVLSGGEAAALTLIDAVVRRLPGVVGNPESLRGESFEDDRLAPPTYTRPESFEGLRVPEVLLSGHHANIEAWRRGQSEERTRRIRPDLWSRAEGRGVKKG